jgi:hypothetical protein
VSRLTVCKAPEIIKYSALLHDSHPSMSNYQPRIQGLELGPKSFSKPLAADFSLHEYNRFDGVNLVQDSLL